MKRDAIGKPQKVILERLLKKYENSKQFLHLGESHRRVMLQTKKAADFPEYDYETASVRDAFNCAAEELQRQGFVSLEWIGNRPVLSAIALNVDNVGAAYERLGKQSPRDLAQSVTPFATPCGMWKRLGFWIGERAFVGRRKNAVAFQSSAKTSRTACNPWRIC